MIVLGGPSWDPLFMESTISTQDLGGGQEPDSLSSQGLGLRDPSL